MKGALYFILFFSLAISCHKDTTPETPKGCGFVGYRYYRGVKDTLGEMSNNYLFVAFDTAYNETDIRKFISANKDFDQQYRYTFYGSKVTALKFNTSKTCEEITNIIFNLQQQPIVRYAHYTIKTYDCQSPIMVPMGKLCVFVYNNLFNVEVYNEKDLTDLYKMIAATNTELVSQDQYMKSWFTLRATKYSKGDALHMVNFFYESKLFAETEPELGKVPVE